MAIHVCSNITQRDAALAACTWGDIIRLQANATFEGTLNLPYKGDRAGRPYIYIESTATPLGTLPANGHRMTPAYTAQLPKLKSTQASSSQNIPAITTANKANGYIIRHLEIHPSMYGSASMIRLGSNDASIQFLKQHQPSDIHIYQCYLNGSPDPANPYRGTLRAVELHGKNLTWDDSYAIGIGTPTTGKDSAAVYALNGEGPYRVTNNYISGSTILFLTGGDSQKIMTNATVSAPTKSAARVSWTQGDPPVAGQTIAFDVNGGTLALHADVISYTPVTTTSGDVTFTPIAVVPDAPGAASWGVVPSDITFERNYCTRPIAQMTDAIVPTPTGVSFGATTGGTLASGIYRIALAARARSNQNIEIVSNAATAVNVTVGANGAITYNATAPTAATGYRLYIQSPAGTWQTVDVAAANGTWTGTLGASATGIASGTKWKVKNLFELKSGLRVVVRYNLFEHGWPGVGNGLAWWLKCVNQPPGSRTPFNETRFVTMEYNRIRKVAGLINVSGCELDINGDQADRPRLMTDLTLRHNLLEQSGSAYAQGKSVNALSLSNGCTRLTIDHNTLDHTITGFMALIANAARDAYFRHLVVTNNLALHNSYGVKGASSVSTASGTEAIVAHSQGLYDFRRNTLAGGTNASIYPPTNEFPTVAAWQGHFENYGAQDYRLKSTSTYKNAGTDGLDLGADVARVLLMTGYAISGTPVPSGEEPPPAPPACTYSLSDSEEHFPAAGGTGSLTITASSPTCAWAVTSSAAWVVPSATSGSGTTAITYSVAANGTADARSAVLSVAGQSVTITQLATVPVVPAPCTYSLNDTSESFPAAGGSKSLTVTTSAPTCAWSVTSSAAWVTPSVTSGTGTTTFSYTVAANATLVERAATLSIGGQSHTITQLASEPPPPPPCTYALDDASQHFTDAGGTGTVTVTTGSTCAWSVTISAPSWISIDIPSGTGTTLLTYTVQPNGTTSARAGTISVAGQGLEITQDATVPDPPPPPPPPCAYVLSPTSAIAAAAGASGTFEVQTTSSCAWSATSSDAWLTLNVSSGTGTTTITWTAAQNLSTVERAATVSVAGESFTVTQYAADPPPPPPCSFVLSPTSRTAPAAGGSGTVEVQTASTCAWSATSSDAWLTLNVSSGTGTTTITYTAAANASLVERAATISVMGQSFTLTQYAADPPPPPPCEYALNDAEEVFQPAGGNGTFDITTGASCAWTATVPEPWVTLSAASGTGPATVTYTVAPNVALTPRTTTISVSGQSLAVQQLAALPAEPDPVDPPDSEPPPDTEPEPEEPPPTDPEPEEPPPPVDPPVEGVPETVVHDIRRVRRTSFVSAEHTSLFYESIQVDMQVGVGTPANDPQVMLRWSDTRGKTWSGERWAGAGTQGAYNRRVIFRRLGRARTRMFEIVISAPYKMVLIDGYADITGGRY